jgi:hypothetical protein
METIWFAYKHGVVSAKLTFATLTLFCCWGVGGINEFVIPIFW